jgi:hypothetical protein
MTMYRAVAPRSVPQIICAWLLLVVTLFSASEAFSAAGDLTLFGPKRYERSQGKPWAFTDSFNGCANSAGQALLRVQNGTSKDSSLSSALITLNGTNVLVEADFKNQSALLEKSVTIRPGSNTIATQLKSGGQKETPFLVVTIIGLGCDSTPPVISSLQPVDGALLNILRPGISASYADNSAGAGIDTASVRVILDGNDITSSCAVEGTSVSCSPAADLPEGGHNIILAVSDLLHNPATLGWSFSTDTIAPQAAIASPANNQYLGDLSVTVSGSIDDPKAIVTVTSTSLGAGSSSKTAAISGAKFSVADVPLTEGENTLTAVAVDSAGNRTESGIKVIVDTTLPQVTVTAPNDGSFTGSNTTSVSGFVSEPPVSVLVNGRSATIAGNDFSLVEFPLAEGLNSLTVEATDPAGHKGITFVTVNLDTINPKISIDSQNDGLLTRSPLLTVSGTVGEPVTELLVNGEKVIVNGSSFTTNLTLAEGLNTIMLEAKDRAGNNGSATITITLDSAAPTAPTLEGLTTPTNRSPVTVSGSAEPLSNVSLYNGADRVATVVTPADGHFSLPEIALHEGENSFTVTALDLAGNESAPSAPVSVVLDTKVPVVGITSPQDKTILNTSAVAISGSIDDPTAAVTVNGLAAINSGGTWTLENFALQEGNNSLLVEAKDPAGNNGSAAITVTLDTILPTVTINTPTDGLYTNIRTLTISGTLSEEVASLTVNGVVVPLSSISTSAWSFTSSLTLAEGVNTITVEAADLAGNNGQGTVTVNLDTLAPQLSVIGPVDGALVNNGQITFGASSAEPVVSVTVNGTAVPLTTGTNGYTLPVSLTEGTNNLTVTAIDKAGNSTTTTCTVSLDSTPPLTPVLNPLPSATNNPATTISGTAEADATVTVTLTTAGTVIATLKADAAGLFSLTDITLQDGVNTFTARATDAAGNDSPFSAPLTIVLDTVKPVITVTAPQAGAIISTSEAAISGTVSEPVSALTVNGQQVTANDLSFSAILPLAAGPNSALLIATDLAGNVATTTLTIQRDSTPPVVVITAPQAGLLTRNAIVQLSGTVDDAEAILTVNGEKGIVNGNVFTFNLTLAEGLNSIIVAATDKAGNSGSAAVSVTLDANPPNLVITAPPEATAGANVAINLTAADNRGLELVELKADGVPIWSSGNLLALAETVSYRLPPTLNAGAVVTLQARGTDAAGNEGSATATISITGAAMGPGYIQGKVLEEGRGHKLEGSTVTIADARGDIRELTTATDGGYFREALAGAVLVKITKPGFTTVERQVAVIPEKNITVLDARLTKISDTKNVIDAVGGVAKATPFIIHNSSFIIELAVPAGALGSSTDLRLTPVSNQGLAGLLPLGWSPLAALDIRSLDPLAGTAKETIFATGATVKLPLPAAITIDPAAPPILARYDNSAHQWLAGVAATVAADGLSAIAGITAAGQYALVFADPAPAAPPTPVEGSILQPSALSLQPDFNQIVAIGKVVPQASPPKAGLKAAGEVVLTAKEGATPTFTSGLVLSGRVTENFDLKSGDKIESLVYSQDLVLYRTPCATSIGGGAVTPLVVSGLALSGAEVGELRTTFPVSPSTDYTIVDLLLGKVGIEIIKPEVSDRGVMVGADGGRLVDADGTILNIPQGALAQTTPVSTRTAAAATGAVGSDFTLIRAVAVNLTRQTLAASATLSIPSPDGFNPSLPLVVAKQIDVKGVAKLKLVALAKQTGSLITSTITATGITLPGITTSGTYYFLQAKGELGFVTGTVIDAANSAYTVAFVKTDKGSLIDLANAYGKYLLAASVAPFTATALDLYKNDETSGSSAVTFASQVVNIDLKIQKIPPTVTAITPANSAVKVQPDVPVVITFSKAMDQSSINATTLRFNEGGGTSVPGSLTFSVDNKTVTFYPAEAFKQETTYTGTISAVVKDVQGYPLGQDTVSSFTVRKTTPPPMPAAGAVSATFPDAEGFITITATQGTAPADCTVLLINDTTGEIVSVTPAANGSFTGRARGQLGDEIKVIIMDYSGNQTLVSYLTFKNTDGSYLVTARGGKVEGEGGSSLEIPEGALVGPAVIKVTALAEANLPSPPQAPGKYLAAFNIDSGGIPFKSEVKLSIPVPPGFNPATPVFLTRPAEVMNEDGTMEKVFEIIDSTKIVDGRITTASPPFEGIVNVGSYAFIEFLDVNIGIVDGFTYQEMNGQPGYQAPPNRAAWEELQAGSNPLERMYIYDRPVTGAVIRTPAAKFYVSYSDAKGFYAGMTTLYGNIGASDLEYKIAATHPLTMQRVTNTGYLNVYSDMSRNTISLNFKLAEKGTVMPDRTQPVIDLGLAVAPVQSATKRIIAGTVQTGTPLSLAVSVTDVQPSSAVLEVTFTAPGAVPVSIPASLVQSGSGQVTVQDGKILTRYLYTPSYTDVHGVTTAYLTPAQEGSYTFSVRAKDATGNEATRTIGFRAIPESTEGNDLEGAPTIDAIIPAANSTEIMVTAPVIVWFSEPVENVTETTFMLIDTTTGEKVPATVISGLENGRMQATLTPKGNLYYARKYEIRLTGGIIDSFDNDNGSRMNLASYSSFFTTKIPKGYDLTTDQQFSGGRDIALYTFDAEDGESTTYAYVLAGDQGWRIVDVTDPTSPSVIHSAIANCNALTQHDCRVAPAEFNFRSVAIDSVSKVMAITENITFSDGNQYGYVRFYDLSESPGFPPIVGKEKLAEAYSGIPGRVSLYGGNAYVATTNVGVQVIGIEQAKANNGQSSDGSSIIGVYDSLSEGFGQPSDIITYGAAKALLTTNSGNLLMLDISLPMPQFMASFPTTQHHIFRAGVAADYPWLDQYGNQQMDDIAVVGTIEGKVLTINLTDPYNPQYMATAKDKDGSELKTTVREISVSKESGLAFVTTVNSVQVIDFKEPSNPRLLIEIVSLPDSNGTIVPLGLIPAIVERGGWVYLASQSQGVKVVDLDPHHLKTIPDPIILADSANGVALADVSIRYEIYPDKAFVPVSAYVVVYEEGQEIWKENVLLEGKGTTIFKATANGRIFNINKKYESVIRLRDAIGVVVEGQERARIPFRWPLLSTDFNRDRIIDDTDLERTKKGDTFFFWLNDDKDSNDVNDNNNPESGTNGADNKVNGATDLEDFFPIHLKIKNAFNFYDPANYNYRLKNVDGALNFVITDLVKQDSGKYLTDPQNNLAEADRLANKTTKQITKDGVILNQYSDFIQQISANCDKGIILVEGRAKTSNPLVLEIVDKKGIIVFSGQLNLSIAGVEQMFRHKNLIWQMYQIENPDSTWPMPPTEAVPIPGHPVTGKIGKLDRLESKDFENKGHFEGWDKETTEGDFVQVHGYNVSTDDARGEQAETFKRLFWSGSKAKFWGITWYGYDSQTEKFCIGMRSPNYHVNVRHAFNAGILLKEFANGKNLNNATFMAHSLGNMVVSTAITKGLNYGRYLMVNAAVAEEYYVPEDEYATDDKWLNNTRPLMYDSAWRLPWMYTPNINDGYQPRLWASEWYKLFKNDPVDDRKNLTWRGFFKKVQTDARVYAFFAPTDQAFRPFVYTLEDVDNRTDIKNYPKPELTSFGLWDFLFRNWLPGCLSDIDRVGTYSWAVQELLKGQVPTIVAEGSDHGGWGFNEKGYGASYCQSYFGGAVTDKCDPLSHIQPAEANVLGDDVLKKNPLFDMNPAHATIALFSEQPVTLSESKQVELLANEIPALTFATGHRGTGAFQDKNIDIRNKYISDFEAWPRDNREWRHSDVFNVAYPHLYKFYDDLTRLIKGGSL